MQSSIARASALMVPLSGGAQSSREGTSKHPDGMGEQQKSHRAEQQGLRSSSNFTKLILEDLIAKKRTSPYFRFSLKSPCQQPKRWCTMRPRLVTTMKLLPIHSVWATHLQVGTNLKY